MSILKTIANILAPSEPYHVTRYAVIFDDAGSLITCLPQEKDVTDADLLAKAAEQYPDKTAVMMINTNVKQYRNGYTYDKATGQAVAPPEPTAEEKQEAALATLDAEYEAKINAKSEEIIQAVTVMQDEELAAQRREELAALKAEYIQKRGDL